MEIMISTRNNYIVVGVSFLDTSEPIFGMALDYKHALDITEGLLCNDPEVIDMFLRLEELKRNDAISFADNLLHRTLHSKGK